MDGVGVLESPEKDGNVLLGTSRRSRNAARRKTLRSESWKGTSIVRMRGRCASNVIICGRYSVELPYSPGCIVVAH